MVCKGVEGQRHKAKKPTNGGRYEVGQSRCQICEVYLYYNGVSCPCCGFRLRKNPRKLKYKEQLRENGRMEYGIKFDREVII